jgi:hypothetical protein
MVSLCKWVVPQFSVPHNFPRCLLTDLTGCSQKATCTMYYGTNRNCALHGNPHWRVVGSILFSHTLKLSLLLHSGYYIYQNAQIELSLACTCWQSTLGFRCVVFIHYLETAFVYLLCGWDPNKSGTAHIGCHLTEVFSSFFFRDSCLGTYGIRILRCKPTQVAIAAV